MDLSLRHCWRAAVRKWGQYCSTGHPGQFKRIHAYLRGGSPSSLFQPVTELFQFPGEIAALLLNLQDGRWERKILALVCPWLNSPNGTCVKRFTNAGSKWDLSRPHLCSDNMLPNILGTEKGKSTKNEGKCECQPPFFWKWLLRTWINRGNNHEPKTLWLWGGTVLLDNPLFPLTLVVTTQQFQKSANFSYFSFLTHLLFLVFCPGHMVALFMVPSGQRWVYIFNLWIWFHNAVQLLYSRPLWKQSDTDRLFF